MKIAPLIPFSYLFVTEGHEGFTCSTVDLVIVISVYFFD